MNHSRNIEVDHEELIEKAEEKPDEVKLELLKHLKVPIKLGNQTDRDVKPEKILYVDLKDAEDKEDIVKALRKHEEKRGDM